VKAVLIKSVAFVAILMLLATLISFVANAIMASIGAGGLGSMNKIAQGGVNAELLVSGSSRAYYHYRPSVLSGALSLTTYNIGTTGGNLTLQLPKLKFYLEHNATPLVLVQDLSVHDLAEIEETIFEPFRYLPFLRNRQLYDGLRDIDPGLWVHRYLPATNLIYLGPDFQTAVLRDLLACRNGRQDYLEDGFSNEYKDRQPEADAWLRSGASIELAVFDENIEHLEELIELCKANGIDLVLVTSPVYSEALAKMDNYDMVTSQIRQTAEANGVYYVDYSEDSVSGNKNLFYDNNHLNVRGATLFSDLLARDLSRYLRLDDR
jgi:hypothetical protein